MSIDTIKLCVGIRDARRSRTSKLPDEDTKTPVESRRLSTLLGIKKVCPSNVELYVKSHCENTCSVLPMITSVTFYCEPGKCFVHEEDTSHTDVYNQYYPPFSLKRLVLEPCEFSIKIKFVDRSFQVIKHSFDLLRYSETVRSFNLNLSKIPQEVTPSPLPSQKFHIVFDLLVPYPYSLEKASSPQHIANFIEKVSLRPCKFVGYYLDEPLEGLSESEKLLYDLSWKLSLVSVPLSADRLVLPLAMQLKSPSVKGTFGLSGLESVLTAIESAFGELRVIRRPGIRVGVDVSCYDLEQLKKLTLQYFKFYDVIEDLVKDYENVNFQFNYPENDKDKVYSNVSDILIQRVEGSHEFSMVGNCLRDKQFDIAKLVDSACCLEELIEFSCPVSSRSYRYAVRPVISKGFLEFRFRMPDIDFHAMSCVIGVLLRFVSSAVALPHPKKFARNGQGKTLLMRKTKFFKWLIQDRFLEVYFCALQPSQQQHIQHHKLSDDEVDEKKFSGKLDTLKEEEEPASSAHIQAQPPPLDRRPSTSALSVRTIRIQENTLRN